MAEKQEAQLYALVSNGLRASKAIGVNEGIPNERSIFPVLQNYARQIEPMMTPFGTSDTMAGAGKAARQDKKMRPV